MNWKKLGKRCVFYAAISPVFLLVGIYEAASFIVDALDRFQDSDVGDWLSEKYERLATWAELEDE